MRKLIVLTLFLAVTTVVSAQTSTPNKQHASGWDRVWFSLIYTPKFMLGESLSIEQLQDNRKTTVHNYAFEAGYKLLPKLSVGAGVGYERYWLKSGSAIDIVPLYLHASYFYGKRGDRGFFNYVRAGGLFASSHESKIGFMGGLGVGYRLKFCNRLGLDLKAGYDYSTSNVNTSPWSEDQVRGRSWSRHSLSLGVGLVF